MIIELFNVILETIELYKSIGFLGTYSVLSCEVSVCSLQAQEQVNIGSGQLCKGCCLIWFQTNHGIFGSFKGAVD